MKKMSIAGFRCFKSSTEFHLGQLTVVTGGNSVGKSSLLKAISVLGDSLSNRDSFKLEFDGANSLMHGVPTLSQAMPWGRGKSKRLDFSVEDGDLQIDMRYLALPALEEALLVHLEIRHAAYGTLFSAKWDTGKDAVESHEELNSREWKVRFNQAFKEVGDFSGNGVYVFDYFFDKARHERRLLSRVAAAEGRQMKSIWKRENETTRAALEALEQELIQNSGSGISRGVKRIEGLRGAMNGVAGLRNAVIRESLKHGGEKGSKSGAIAAVEMLSSLEGRFGTVHHLSSKREVAPRVAQYGSALFNIYRDIYLEDKKNRFDDGRKYMVRWMRKLGIGSDFIINNIEGAGYTVGIKTTGSEEAKNLADFAMGQAQMFRLLMVMAKAINDSGHKRVPVRLLIEEPDANLHPNMQSQLVAPILDAMGRTPGLSIIIETHSEYLVRRLQSAVKSKELDKDDLIINYVASDRGRITAEKVTLGDDGKLSQKLGTGFMDEGANLAMELI